MSVAVTLIDGADLGVALRPLPGEVSCGDQAACWIVDRRPVLCLADGLGHGDQAEEAALAALSYLQRHWSWNWPELLTGCDRAITHTRGVALGIAAIEPETKSLTFVGIGNIRLQVVGGKTRNYQAIPGIVGAGRLHVRPETVSLDGSACLVLFTDGIESRFDLLACPSPLFNDMRLLARGVVDGWGRSHDDAGVIAWRCPPGWYEGAERIGEEGTRL